MNLLIDIGNTRLKWCLLIANEFSNSSTLICTDKLNEDLFIAWKNLIVPQNVIIASVATSVINKVVTSIITALWNIEPVFVKVQPNICGVTTNYSNPSQLGIDRWLALIATRRRGAKSAVVVDCGTAVTIDVLNNFGHHIGGLIIPGLRLLRQSIFDHTNIPYLNLSNDFNLLGQNTGECIAAGTVQAIVGTIEIVHKRAMVDNGISPRLILTGGDAVIIAIYLTIPHSIIPELVFEGLAALVPVSNSHFDL
jgi:type III pantothenate kinase